MRARESGTTFDCHPWSAWNFCIALLERESQTPLGWPSIYFSRIRADWISRTRSGFMAAWPRGFLVLPAFFPLAVLWLELDLPDLWVLAVASAGSKSARLRRIAVTRSRWFKQTPLISGRSQKILCSEAARNKPQRWKQVSQLFSTTL